MRKRFSHARLWAGALALAGLVTSVSARAQAIDAGDYVPAPDGTQLGLVYLQYAHSGALYAHGQKVDDKASLDSAIAILRYVGFTKVAGHTLDYQILQPYGTVWSGGSTSALGKTSGFADTILVSTLWLHENAKTGTYFGVTPYLYLPTGNYNHAQSLNLGENRWKGSFQAVLSQKVSKHFIAEVAGDVMVYGHNTNYGVASQTLTQMPTFRVQGFARYLLNDKNELNLRLMYVGGGRQTVAGLDQDNVTKTTSVLGTWRTSLSPKWQLMTQVGGDLHVENGFKEGTRVQLRILRIF
jgi:hypothetical protein